MRRKRRRQAESGTKNPRFFLLNLSVVWNWESLSVLKYKFKINPRTHVGLKREKQILLDEQASFTKPHVWNFVILLFELPLLILCSLTRLKRKSFWMVKAQNPESATKPSQTRWMRRSSPK